VCAAEAVSVGGILRACGQSLRLARRAVYPVRAATLQDAAQSVSQPPGYDADSPLPQPHRRDHRHISQRQYDHLTGRRRRRRRTPFMRTFFRWLFNENLYFTRQCVSNIIHIQ